MSGAELRDGVPTFLVQPSADARPLYSDIVEPGGPRGDSGVDVRFPGLTYVPASSDSPDCLSYVVDLGIRARCVLNGEYVPFQIVPRSSISKTPLGLANSIGIIDRGYTGPLKVALRNHGKDLHVIELGTALFQLVRPDLVPARVQLVDGDHPAFAEGATKRGAGGFGSTGADGKK
jgi:dUTP pyrophosphatase